MWTGSYIKKYVPSASHNFFLYFTEYQMDGPIKNVDSYLHLHQALIIPGGTVTTEFLKRYRLNVVPVGVGVSNFKNITFH
jgi:hypothetical protein